MRNVGQTPIELECGAGWKADNRVYSATASSKPSTANESQENLRGEEAYGGNSGIWKSTSAMVEYGR